MRVKKKTVIEYFGSVNAVAAALGISQSAVSQWRENVPEGSAYKLEVITQGALRACDSGEQNSEKAAA